MTIDIGNIKPGDRVTVVDLEVIEVLPSTVKVKSGGGPAYYSHEDIIRHYPKPRALEIGHLVLRMADSYGAAVTGPWVVIGIYKHRVWLGAPEGERETYAQTIRDNLKYMDGTRAGA
jgi:hypothetical protein